MPPETPPASSSFFNKKVFLSLGLILVVGAYVIWQRVSSPASAPATTPTTPITPTATPEVTPTVTPTPEVTGKFKDGSYTGTLTDSIFGAVQVKAVIKNGQLADVVALKFPNDRETSIKISNDSLPVMTREALQIQSEKVDVVSGATQTWEAYVASLGSALKLAAR